MRDKLEINNTVSSIYTKEIEPLYNQIEAAIKLYSPSSRSSYQLISEIFDKLSTKVLIFSDTFLHASKAAIKENTTNVGKFIEDNSNNFDPTLKESISVLITDNKYNLLKHLAEQQDKNNLNFSQKNNVEKPEIEEAVNKALKPFFANLMVELNTALSKSATSQNQEKSNETEANRLSFYNRKKT